MSSSVFSLALATLVLWHEGFSQLLDEKCYLEEPSFRIMRGQDAKPTPWMAGIYNAKTNELLCGGTLISKNVVLTAAHCIENQKYLRVRLGDHDRSCSDSACPERETYYVIKAVMHRDYKSHTMMNDIGLLKLQHDVSYKAHIKPICIIMEDNVHSAGIDTFSAFGWGRISSNEATSQVLQTISLTRKNSSECMQNGLTYQYYDKQLCAGHDAGDTCTGDSGGPLVADIQYQSRKIPVQVGIISYGKIKCDGVGVYTDVMAYKDWFRNLSEIFDVSHNRTDRTEIPDVLYDQCGSSWTGAVNVRLWEVSLLEHNFTGALITDQFVVTVASAFLANSPVIKVETRYLATFDVESIHKHPHFGISPLRNNIALLKLARKIPNSHFIKSICLGLKQSPPTSLTALLYSDREDIIGAQKVNVSQIKSSDCSRQIETPVQPNQFCVEKPRGDYVYETPGSVLGTFDMRGDAKRYLLVGIISFVTNGVLVFTNVTSYEDWIIQIIGE